MLINDKVIDKKTAGMYSPLTLAYLGDCVFELLVRESLVLKANKSNGKLHSEAKKLVCASGQNTALLKIINNLSEEEEHIYKRGRNSNCIPGGRNVNLDEYKRATGLEALFGYLYLIGEVARIEQLFDMITDETEA
jgi:ribonuclease-3 family protein